MYIPVKLRLRGSREDPHERLCVDTVVLLAVTGCEQLLSEGLGLRIREGLVSFITLALQHLP